MQITAPALSNVSNPQMMVTPQEMIQEMIKGAGDTACKVQSGCFDDSSQRPEHKPLSGYRVGKLARSVLQAGTGLVRSTAGFVFKQVMNSREMGALAPGLKENMMVLAALCNEFTQACGYESSWVTCKRQEGSLHCGGNWNPVYCLSTSGICNGERDCDDGRDEGPNMCDQDKCNELNRSFLCGTYECISRDLRCNGHVDCRDGSDESAETCATSNAHDWSYYALIAAPAIIGATVLSAGIAYTCCAYKSYHALREDDQESSGIQLCCQALRHPKYYRQQDPARQVAMQVPMQQALAMQMLDPIFRS